MVSHFHWRYARLFPHISMSTAHALPHIRLALPSTKRSPGCIYSHEIVQHSGNLLE